MNIDNANAVKWFRSNSSDFSGQLFFSEPLSKHTFYRIGGPASVFAAPTKEEDLRWLSNGVKETGIPVFILGAGSNILAPDEGFQGLVVRTNRLNLEISGHKESELRVGGSVAVSTLIRKMIQDGYGGLEFLAGIPGSIGGAIAMNAGTKRGEVKDRLLRVEVIVLSPEYKDRLCFEKKDLCFEYRKNMFLPYASIIWSADWSVYRQDPAAIKKNIDDILSRRKVIQPLDSPSCGSIFKNPQGSGVLAWQVIDRIGLRGHRIGDAAFAQKHCNFIINLGGAKAADVRALIDLAKEKAKQDLGITLETEVILL
ncbi:MAG: UDP-N-acetylmuramate dehydrogenase [Bdellovibrionota bacterium]